MEYEIFAIRYATLIGWPVSWLVSGANPARNMDLAMMVWLLRGNGHNILVDAGFYREQMFHDDRFNIADFIKPSEKLAVLGLKPADITDVILTHMHWDHADGMDLFPNAQVWIQKDEYTYYTGEAWQDQETARLGFDRDDMLALVKANLEGHLTLVNGDNQEILPGVTCYTGGRHTYATQHVGVSTAKGTVVIASDNVPLGENLVKHAPTCATVDAESNLRAQDRMKQIASDIRFIVPGHDPAVFTDFPVVADGVAKIE